MDTPFLIVGLGNPGPEYADTRHNLGFRVIEELARRWPDVRFGKKFHGEFAQVSRGAHRVLLLMPQTYMNRSGLSVGEAATFFKVDTENRLLVVYDDLDTPSATLRVRASGGPGGHNGMKSIIQSIGSEKFPRLRLGIGRPPKGPTDGYVLARIPSGERQAYEDLIKLSCDAVETFLDGGVMKAMNTFNVKGNKDES